MASDLMGNPKHNLWVVWPVSSYPVEETSEQVKGAM